MYCTLGPHYTVLYCTLGPHYNLEHTLRTDCTVHSGLNTRYRTHWGATVLYTQASLQCRAHTEDRLYCTLGPHYNVEHTLRTDCTVHSGLTTRYRTHWRPTVLYTRASLQLRAHTEDLLYSTLGPHYNVEHTLGTYYTVHSGLTTRYRTHWGPTVLYTRASLQRRAQTEDLLYCTLGPHYNV